MLLPRAKAAMLAQNLPRARRNAFQLKHWPRTASGPGTAGKIPALRAERPVCGKAFAGKRGREAPVQMGHSPARAAILAAVPKFTTRTAKRVPVEALAKNSQRPWDCWKNSSSSGGTPRLRKSIRREARAGGPSSDGAFARESCDPRSSPKIYHAHGETRSS